MGTKLIGSFVLLIVATVVATFFINHTAATAIKNQIAESLVFIGDAKEEHLFDFLEGIKNRAADFSSDGFIRDSAKEIIFDKNVELVQALKAHLETNKMPLDKNLYQIDIINLDGIVVASTEKRATGQKTAREFCFLKGKESIYGAPHLGEPFIHEMGGKRINTITVSAPLTDKKTGEKIAVIMNFVKAEAFDDVMAGSERFELKKFVGHPKISTNIETYLINADGLLLSKTKLASYPILEQKIETKPVKECAAGKEIVEIYKNYAGINVVGKSSCLTNGWVMLTEIPENVALAPINYITQIIRTMGALIIGGAFILISFLLANVITPIKKTAALAARIGAGDLTQRLEVTSKDEIGQLTTSFNEMANKLRDLYAGLEQKIEDKTKDLQKFKLAVDGASDHIIITDQDGSILYANKAAEDITGYSRTEMIGKRPSLWGKQMDKKFYEQMWKTIKIDKKKFVSEIQNKRKNGEMYYAQTSIAPITDETGEIKFFVGIERDVTKEKEIDRAKTEFISLASHQLRSPLSTINWYIESLLDKKGTATAKDEARYLKEIYHGGQRMVKMINALLDASRIEIGTMPIKLETVDIVRVAKNVLEVLSPKIKQKKIKVTTRFYAKLPTLNADLKLIQTIFQNILENAVIYTPKNGKISLEITTDKDSVLIKVADNGCGIPKEQQSKIFTKLFRADNAREVEPDGTGLGLYISKSILDKTGGRIWFESEKNKGSTFYVTIPLSGMRKKLGPQELVLTF